MATHSSILVWSIPWTEEPGELQSMGLQRVRHDRNNLVPMLGLLRTRNKTLRTTASLVGALERGKWEMKLKRKVRLWGKEAGEKELLGRESRHTASPASIHPAALVQWEVRDP